MKHITKFLSLALALLMLVSVFATVPITAGAKTSGDYKYSILDDGTAEITKYSGNAAEINIPSEIDGYIVTSIGGSAFLGCSSLTRVTIPDSVSTIRNYAFVRCESLENITIPNSVKSIGGYGFWHCTNLKSITIPESVTELGYSPFGFCTNLTNITVNENNKKFASLDGNLYNKDCTTLIQYAAGKTDSSFAIPNSVTYIGYEAFGGCSGIKNITIPNSVKSVNQAVFLDCTNLISVTIPNSIKSISYCMFSGCSNLTNVVIPDNVTKIESDAFYGCASLKNITIPYSVTSIGDNALGYDEHFKKIKGFTIKGYSNSKAEKYAKKNGFKFVSIGKAPINTSTLKLKKSSVSLKAGQTSTIIVQNKGDNKITYKSSNTKVATVKNGKVTALKKGTAKITVTVGKKKLTYKVSVAVSPKLSQSTVNVKEGKTVAVKITGKASGVNNKYTNTNFAKVTSKNSASTLKIKGLKKGKTTLKIQVNGVILKLKVTVK